MPRDDQLEGKNQMNESTNNRFQGSNFTPHNPTAFDSKSMPWEAEAKHSFINLIKTPGGFEFDLHVSGQRKPPQRLQKGDKYMGTYLLPFTPEECSSFLKDVCGVASQKDDKVGWIKKTLAEYRWQPELKGFGQ